MNLENTTSNAPELNASYRVTSSWVCQLDFGTLAFGGISFNCVLMTLNNAQQYLYYGLSDEAFSTVEELVIRHCENGDISIGDVVNEYLRPLPVYSRLHGSI